VLTGSVSRSRDRVEAWLLPRYWRPAGYTLLLQRRLLETHNDGCCCCPSRYRCSLSVVYVWRRQMWRGQTVVVSLSLFRLIVQ
jgi:hypothetical protein